MMKDSRGTYSVRKHGALPLFCAALLLANQADAHIVAGEAVGFISGMEHPVGGVDHIIAMVAVGLWGAQLGAPAVWLLPITFPLVMAFAGFLGLVGVALPGIEIGIALSGVCLGACVLAELRPPSWIAALLVGAFGLFHGYAHGVELPPGENALLYSMGFVLATGLLHATGIALGFLHRWGWGRSALRGAGAVILCGGLYFAWAAIV